MTDKVLENYIPDFTTAAIGFDHVHLVAVGRVDVLIYDI